QRVDLVYLYATGLRNVHDAGDWDRVLCHYTSKLVRWGSILSGNAGWLGRHRHWQPHAWSSSALGFNFGGMSLDNLTHSVSNFGFSFPLPAVGHVVSGIEFLGRRRGQPHWLPDG